MCPCLIKFYLNSEQQLVSCSGAAYSNYGCNGGFYTRAWKYIFDVRGLTSSAVSPYTATAVPSMCVPRSTKILQFQLIAERVYLQKHHSCGQPDGLQLPVPQRDHDPTSSLLLRTCFYRHLGQQKLPVVLVSRYLQT